MKIDFRWNLIDQIAASILILDQFGTIQYLNNDACELLGYNDAEDIIGQELSQYFSEEDQNIFDEYLTVVSEGGKIEGQDIHLCSRDGSLDPIILTANSLENASDKSEYSIWTLKLRHVNDINSRSNDHERKLEDIQWLADQGRNLLSLNDWTEILDLASRALQEKLNDCIVISLVKVDESNLQLHGIFGLENRILNQVWRLVGQDLQNKVIAIDERFRDIYSKRRLYKHPDGLETFAISQVPVNISSKLSKLIGLKNIYTIGLEGNQEVLGCFYIFTLDPDLVINTELVESFSFQVALALEKSKYAEELEISEQQFQTIFEYTPDGYYISDPQGNFLDVNLAAEKITGYAKEELIGKNFLKVGLLSKNQIPLAGKLIIQGIAGKSTGPDEFDLTRKDGSVVTVEVSSYPVKMGDKSVILGIARDITHRKLSEEKLNNAQESLTRVLEEIDAHVHVADLHTWEILYMNKRMIEDYGGNFVGKLCHEIFRNNMKPCSDCSNSHLINNHGEPGEVYVWEGQNKTNHQWYRNYDRAIYWTDQRLARMQIAVDISDNKMALDSLQQSETRYRSLFETSHNALMTISPPDWRFTSGNSAMIKVFGLEDENQFLDLQPWQLSPEYQPDGQLSGDKAQEMINIALENGTNFFHWTHKKISGAEFPATVQLTRVDIKDKYFLQATVRDVSDTILADRIVQQQMDDLELINKLSVAANNGFELTEILAVFSEEAERIFKAKNASVFLLNDDETKLLADPELMNTVPREMLRKLKKNNQKEKFVLDLDRMDLFRKAILSGEVKILSQREEIQKTMEYFIDASQTPELFKSSMRKIAPEIISRQGIQSVMILPLVASDRRYGLVLVPSQQDYTEKDQERFVSITEQLSGIIYRTDIQREKKEKSEEVEFIYQTLLKGTRIDDIDEICNHLADSVRKINPEAYLLVSLYDPEYDTIRIRAIKGLGKFGDQISNLLGGKPEDFQINTSQFQIDEDLNNLYTSGKLERVPGGIYDLARGKISKRMSKSIERLTSVDQVYIVGFSLHDQSTGGLILCLKKGVEIIHPKAIEAVVSHYSIIFERRLIQTEVMQRKQQLEALRDVELEIVSELDIDLLLQSISEKAKSMVNASACGFSVYNPDRNVLEYTAYTGFEELPDNTDLYPGEGLSGKVWESKETLTVSNYAEWEGRSEKWAPVSNFYLAGVPVIWGEEILGVLEIALDPGGSLTVSELATLELFATQAAIAIKNARLFSEEKLRRNEAETLREVGVLINRMVDRPELLDMILSSLQKVVSYSSASVQLVNGSEIVVEAYNGEKIREDIVGNKYQIQTNEAAKQILIDGKNIILGSEVEVQELLEGPNLGEINSWLAVPLESKGNRIGILALDHKLPNQFTKRDAEMVKDFATQAVVALENNRLFEEIRRRTSEIEAVYASALSLTKELHPEVLFEHLYQQIEPLFKPDAYILATYDQTSDMINVAYATEAGIRQPQAEGLQISPDDQNSLLSWIVRKKSPLLIGNVETDSIPVQPLQSGEVIRSWLGVPLLMGDRIFGALVVQSYQANVYTRDHQRLIQLLGNQMAIALENSRLFNDATRRLDRLSSLREIDQAISGGTDLALTMDVLVNQLINTLKVDAACVLAYRPSRQVLEYVDAKGFRTKSLQYTALKLGDGLAGKAALEQSLVIIPDLNNQSTSFQQSPLFCQEGFVTYLAQPLITKGGLVGVLEVFHRTSLTPDPEWFTFLDAISRLAAIAIDRLNLYDNLEKSNIELTQAYEATIEGWAKAIELRDGDTEGHSRRVEALTMNLARKMGVSDEELVHMRRGALLHDIGKMAIPDGILLKSGKLTDEEWMVMKKHPVYAYDMLSKIEYLELALDIPTCHHERWDGSGYPGGLAGENIPLQARIFAVVDVWDALQSDRPYREAWSEDKTIQYLKDQSGKEFDPRIVIEFLDLIGKG